MSHRASTAVADELVRLAGAGDAQGFRGGPAVSRCVPVTHPIAPKAAKPARREPNDAAPRRRLTEGRRERQRRSSELLLSETTHAGSIVLAAALDADRDGARRSAGVQQRRTDLWAPVLVQAVGAPPADRPNHGARTATGGVDDRPSQEHDIRVPERRCRGQWWALSPRWCRRVVPRAKSFRAKIKQRRASRALRALLSSIATRSRGFSPTLVGKLE